MKFNEWPALCLFTACLAGFVGCGGENYKNPDVQVVTDEDIRDFPDDDDDIGGGDAAAEFPDD
jgi:hypothetical protein